MMDSFMKKIFDNRPDEECHYNFVRFGRGNYSGRFVVSFTKGEKVKVRASFEMANDFVKLAEKLDHVKFSGKVLSKEKINGIEGKKKAGAFVYEISGQDLSKFKEVYFHLLDASSNKILLKIKKSLPKPGKDGDKIDDKFCSLDVDKSIWPEVKKSLFWDIDDNVKKARVSHDLLIADIIYPKGETDPAKIRELAKRKGTITRKILADGKENLVKKEFIL